VGRVTHPTRYFFFLMEELKESTGTQYCTIEDTTLSGGRAMQGGAQHRQEEGGHALELFPRPPGDLTVCDVRCRHVEIRQHREPKVVEATEALVIL
jgi:hypothetical protein